MTIEIRPARSSDASELTRLLQTSDSAPHVCSDEALVERALETCPAERVLVADAGGQLVGFACLQVTSSFQYDRCAAELTSLFVVEPYRRQGVASGLISATSDLCENENCLELFLRVNRWNTEAINCYRSCGLEEAGHLEFRFKYYG